MSPLPKKCEDLNAVMAFCDCISGEEPADAAAQAFCGRAAEGRATGDELVELKKALKDLEEPEADPDECCCEC